MGGRAIFQVFHVGGIQKKNGFKVGISSIGGTTTFPAGSWISSYAKLYFQILLKVKEKIQSGAFQKIKFQKFLQPW